MNIIDIKRKLLIKYPFFGNVIANVTYKENKMISTAATDGKNIIYNQEFLDSLDDKKQLFTIAHEVCHIAFDHINRGKGKIPTYWNIATDAVINQLLIQDGLSLVDGAVDLKEAINYNVEEYYEKLVEKNKNQQNENNQYQFGHDTHECWGKNLEKESEDNSQDIAKISKMVEQKAFAENKKEKQKILERFKQKLAKESLPGIEIEETRRKIDNVGEAKPLIDWRYLLKEALKYEIDWSYQNATVENSVITPHLEEQLYSETEIVLDTSGSIDDELLKSFLKECKNIWKVSRLKVGCFDVRFYGFQEIRYGDDIDNLTFSGGGGTDFNVAVNAFSNRAENKIIFTDGIAEMPEKYLEAIWLVYGPNKINPKGGKVIYISKQDLIKLKTKFNLTLKKKNK